MDKEGPSSFKEINLDVLEIVKENKLLKTEIKHKKEELFELNSHLMNNETLYRSMENELSESKFMADQLKDELAAKKYELELLKEKQEEERKKSQSSNHEKSISICENQTPSKTNSNEKNLLSNDASQKALSLVNILLSDINKKIVALKKSTKNPQKQ